jgi:hypothetical protein
MNVLIVTRIHYITRVSRLKNAASPPSTFVFPTQSPALVARHATVRTVAAKICVYGGDMLIFERPQRCKLLSH